MKNLKRQDRNGTRTSEELRRRYRFDQIELTEDEVEYLKQFLVVDSALSTTSEHAVQNKVITQALNTKASTESLNTKVDKEEGKGLSTNDFTTTLLNKLNGIAENAKDNVIESISVNGTPQTVTNKNVNIQASIGGGDYLPLAGGTMTGLIKSENKAEFGALQKTRTVNDVDYKAIFGVGSINNKGTVALELQSATGEVIGRIDATADGILRNGKTGGTFIDSTGGTFTGKVTWGSSGLYASHANGIYFDQYGNIYTQQALTTGNWRIQNGSNIPLKIDFSDNSIRARGVYPQATNTYDLGSTNYYWKSFYTQSVISSMGVRIPKNSSSSYYGLCNTDGKPIIRDHGNNNVTVDATGGTLYLGYQNTTGLNFMSGKASMNSTGDLNINGSLTSGNCLYLNKGAIQSTNTYNNDTVTNAANLYITSGGWIRRTTGSSERWKKDITEEIEDRLNPEALYDLPIKQFKYKDDCISENDVRYGKNILGFIAEDVAEVYEPAVQYDEEGQVEMWNAQVMIPAMLKLIQEQKKEIDNLKNKLADIESKIS